LAKDVVRSLLEEVRKLLSNAGLDKSFWAEAIEYASHLMNRSTTIGGKASLDIRSEKAAQDHGVLREFKNPAYFSTKNSKMNPRAKRFVYLGVKGNSYRLWDPENKKIVMSRNVTFEETSGLKSTVSQQVERTKTKDRLHRVEVDATASSPVGLALEETSSEVTAGGDYETKIDAEQIEDIAEDVELFAAIGTEVKSRLWFKKHESQACDLDELKLKAVALHDGREEIHMSQSDGFATAHTGTSA